jgi:hypothetical protein
VIRLMYRGALVIWLLSPTRALAGGAIALSVVSMVAACGGQASVSLPGKALPGKAPAAAAASAPALSARQQVVTAYTGYLSALAAADDSRSAARARAILGKYLPASTIGSAVSAFRAYWRRGEVSYGSVVPHLLRVRVSGDRAYVHDCQDTTGSGLADARTGQAIPGTMGTGYENLITRLQRVRGRWLVMIQTVLVASCQA